MNQFDSLVKDSSSEHVVISRESLLDTSEELLLCIVSGEGTLNVNEEILVAKSGKIIAIPKHAKVTVTGNLEVIRVEKARFKN